MPLFKSRFSKRLLVLSIVFIFAGALGVGLSMSLLKVETFDSTSVDMFAGTWTSYISERFRLERGNWIDIDLQSTGVFDFYVRTGSIGDVLVSRSVTSFIHTVKIQQDDVYFIQADNKYGGNNNHLTGNIYLRRTPSYLSSVSLLANSLIVIGALLIPAVVLVESYARRRSKPHLVCPRCGRQVQTSKTNCPYCKLDLMKHWVKCKYCKTLYDSELGKCPDCGARN